MQQAINKRSVHVPTGAVRRPHTNKKSARSHLHPLKSAGAEKKPDEMHQLSFGFTFNKDGSQNQVSMNVSEAPLEAQAASRLAAESKPISAGEHSVKSLVGTDREEEVRVGGDKQTGRLDSGRKKNAATQPSLLKYLTFVLFFALTFVCSVAVT